MLPLSLSYLLRPVHSAEQLAEIRSTEQFLVAR